ncbi:hypothetical protein D3C76_1866000 [compost metagenome]
MQQFTADGVVVKVAVTAIAGALVGLAVIAVNAHGFPTSGKLYKVAKTAVQFKVTAQNIDRLVQAQRVVDVAF